MKNFFFFLFIFMFLGSTYSLAEECRGGESGGCKNERTYETLIQSDSDSTSDSRPNFIDLTKFDVISYEKLRDQERICVLIDQEQLEQILAQKHFMVEPGCDKIFIE